MKRFLFGLTLLLGSTAAFAQDGGADAYNKGLEAYSAKDFATAYTMFDKALSNPGDMEIQADYYFYAADAAERSEHFDAAVKYYKEAIKGGAKVDNSKEGAARSLVSLGKYDEAMTVDADNAGKWAYQAAATAYKAKDYTNSATYFGKAVELNFNGDNSALYQYNSLLKLKKGDEAEAAIKAAAEKYPNSKASKKYSDVIYKDGVAAYKAGVSILTDANNAVAAGTFTTEDDQYKKALADSKAKMKEAVAIFEDALAVDAANANAKKYMEACKAAM
ncbi:MAG: hypothetical protein ACK5LR_11240 [Mangrovibacterium sp.]